MQNRNLMYVTIKFLLTNIVNNHQQMKKFSIGGLHQLSNTATGTLMHVYNHEMVRTE